MSKNKTNKPKEDPEAEKLRYASLFPERAEPPAETSILAPEPPRPSTEQVAAAKPVEQAEKTVAQSQETRPTAATTGQPSQTASSQEPPRVPIVPTGEASWLAWIKKTLSNPKVWVPLAVALITTAGVIIAERMKSEKKPDENKATAENKNENKATAENKNENKATIENKPTFNQTVIIKPDPPKEKKADPVSWGDGTLRSFVTKVIAVGKPGDEKREAVFNTRWKVTCDCAYVYSRTGKAGCFIALEPHAKKPIALVTFAEELRASLPRLENGACIAFEGIVEGEDTSVEGEIPGSCLLGIDECCSLKLK
jgi:hypothetical protein